MDIKDLRKKLAISQEEFARRLGVSLQTISRWELGKTKPSQMARRLLDDMERRLLDEQGEGKKW